MLRYINSSTRKLYAFEMDQANIGTLSDSDPSINNIDLAPADSQGSTGCAQGDVKDRLSGMDTYRVTSTVAADPSGVESSSYYNQGDLGAQYGYISGSNDLDIIGTGMWEWGQGVESKRRTSLETEPGESWLSADSTTTDNTAFNIAENIAKAIGDQSIDVHVGSEATATVTSSEAVEASSDWKSCAICLEELPETDLLVHTTCGGTFCSTCLEVSVHTFAYRVV